MKKMLLAVAALLLVGCSTFTTNQEDIRYEKGQLAGKITTKVKARSFWDSKSALANFKAGQTEKSQSATVGSLNQESSATNAVALVGVAVEAAVTAAVKSAKPVP